MEQRIHGVSYPLTSSKNVLSEWIPFDFSHPLLMSLHLKDNFAFGIRPSDDGAIVAPSSQLGPVHLHIKIIKWKRATLFVMSIRLCASCLNAEQITKWKFSEIRITYVPFNWPNLFYILAFEFPFDSPIGKRDEPIRSFEYRHLPVWTAGKNGVRRVETTYATSRYLWKRQPSSLEYDWWIVGIKV